MDGQKGKESAGFTGLFKRLIRFCRRLSENTGFRRITRILIWVFIAYMIYNIALFLIAVMNTGATFLEALRFFLQMHLFENGRIPASASVFYGITLGLIWHFLRNRKNRDEAEEEKEEAKTAGSPEPVQEEPVSTTRYQSR